MRKSTQNVTCCLLLFDKYRNKILDLYIWLFYRKALTISHPLSEFEQITFLFLIEGYSSSRNHSGIHDWIRHYILLVRCLFTHSKVLIYFTRSGSGAKNIRQFMNTTILYVHLIYFRNIVL